ncbi:MAG: phosphatase PAP2 family protein [Acidobacteriaceae bacterium]|nr:phosphatase PAP2 family protein [Acidobacteriaceae bacterium]
MNRTGVLTWGGLGLVLVSVVAHGQNLDCSTTRSEPLVGPTSQTSSDYDRPVSWKLLAPNILCDQKSIWLFPVRLPQNDNWAPALGVVGGTAGLLVLDPSEGRYFHQTSAYSGFNRVFTSKATAVAEILVPSSMYLAGWLHKDGHMESSALLEGEAVADAEIVATALKDITSRKRPYSFSSTQNYADSFYDHAGSKVIGGGGFPSGHTIAAFAIATVIAHRYRQQRWIPYVAFGAATAVGFSRLSLSQHFASDVFAGAALGYSISRFVVLRY